MNNETVISAKSLDLTFQTNDGPVHALKDVNLNVTKGDFVSFIGPSGCGKTTFLRVMADLDQPTDGTITINGVSPKSCSRKSGIWICLSISGTVSVAHNRKKYTLTFRNNGDKQV